PAFSRVSLSSQGPGAGQNPGCTAPETLVATLDGLLYLASLWALIHGEGEDVGAGVVADGVEAVAGAGEGVGVEVGVEDAFFAVEWAGEVVAEWGEDGAAVAADDVGGEVEVGHRFGPKV